MAAAERLRRALGGWRLPELAAAWVDTMWDLEFTEFEPLDPRVADDITADGVDSFTDLYSALAPFAAGEQESRENVWILFAENSLSHQALVAVLYHFVHVGQQKRANAEQRVFALHAAGLYFLLLEIPGSIINQVFHEVVFDKCLHTLTKCLPRDLRKRKKSHAQSSQSSARRNRKKGRPCRNDSPSVEEMLEEEEEEEDEDVYWSREGLLQVRKAIFLLLKNFLRLLTKFSLEEKPQCLQNCVQVFVEMTSFEPVLHEFNFSASMDVNKAECIPEVACYGLYLLCSPLHGTQDKNYLTTLECLSMEKNLQITSSFQTLQCVFHRLLYVILMAESSEDSMHEVLPITAAVTSARNLAIKLISSLVDELKEAIYPTLRILLQHICAQVPDKADYRTYAAQALATLLDKLPCAEFASFIAWLYKFSLYEVPSRVFALDAALALLELPERNPGSSLSLEDQRFLKHKFLVQVMVFGRCSDIAPVVRSKALSSLDCCLEMKSAAISESIQDLLQSSPLHTVLEASASTASVTASAGAVSGHPLKTFLTSKTFELTDSSDAPRPAGEEFMAILRERAGDEKIIVRKPAVRVLGSLLKHGHMPCTAENVGTLRDRCRDPAASVCKQALHSITELLLFQHNNVLVQKAWWNGVVPVVTGAENSVQEKALDCLDQILLQNIKPYNKSRSDDRQKLAWDLLSLSSESKELGRYLSRALTMWSSQKKLTSTFIQNVMSHLETEHSSAAWMLLAKVAGSSPKLDYSKIIESWYSRQQNTSSDAVGHILCVIGHVAEHLPRSCCEGLRENIRSWLKEFRCPRVLISPAVQALQRLCRASVDVPKEAQELLNQVFGDLVSTCYSYISSIVLKEGGAEQLQEDLLVRHLFLLGEAAQMCPAKVEKYIFFLVQAILAPPVSKDQLSTSKDSSQPLSQFRGSAMPTVVRAHAVMTLGKLCLQHEELARESIPVLVQELEVSQEMPVRINAVTALCDLCVLYTSLVDRYIPSISLCLQDPHPVIREHTLTLLTNLLQFHSSINACNKHHDTLLLFLLLSLLIVLKGEYVKLKNYLFFRFVSILVDPNPDIASFAEYCLVHVLLMRNPVIFSQHFIECIFHFNSYEKHPKYNRFPQSERAKQLFSLKGKDNKEKRMRIYTFLLEHFTDEQRFNITTMISDNILACFVYKVLPLDLEGSELLSDTFAVLSCKEIKLSSMRSKPEEDIQPEEDEMSTASAVVRVAQKKLILQGQKKNLIENIIPTITSLKSLMEQKRTPALKDLMNCLREIMQDYRNEIKDFFAEDQQLVVELEYDMRKYEEQLAREKELEQEQLSAAHWEQSPSLERAASPGGQNNNNAQSPASGRPPTSGFIPSSGSSELAIPRAGALKQPQVGRRASLLSTVARLNAAFLAAEGAPVQRSRSLGRSSPASPGAPSTSGSQQVSCRSPSQKSRREKVAVVGPAISTPEQPETIGDLTFGAGVSSISSIHTPSSGPAEEDDDDEDRPKCIICLPPPEEPPSPPWQWNVESPARRRSSQQVPLQQSQCKTPLELAK